MSAWASPSSLAEKLKKKQQPQQAAEISTAEKKKPKDTESCGPDAEPQALNDHAHSADAQPHSVVLSKRTMAKKQPDAQDGGAQAVVLDRDSDAAAEQPQENVPPTVNHSTVAAATPPIVSIPHEWEALVSSDRFTFSGIDSSSPEAPVPLTAPPSHPLHSNAPEPVLQKDEPLPPRHVQPPPAALPSAIAFHHHHHLHHHHSRVPVEPPGASVPPNAIAPPQRQSPPQPSMPIPSVQHHLHHHHHHPNMSTQPPPAMPYNTNPPPMRGRGGRMMLPNPQMGMYPSYDYPMMPPFLPPRGFQGSGLFSGPTGRPLPQRPPFYQQYAHPQPLPSSLPQPPYYSDQQQPM